jgi:AmiR/NasT family two-component response regulator
VVEQSNVELIEELQLYWQDLQTDPTLKALIHDAVSAEVAEFVAHRSTIEQAKGVLMQLLAIDADRAFAVLLRYSQHRNVKLRVLAQRLVDMAARDETPPKHASTERVASMFEEMAAEPPIADQQTP